MCKQNWGDVKTIKAGKHLYIGGSRTEKGTIICTRAWMRESRTVMNELEKAGANNDEVGVNVDDLTLIVI